MSARKRRYGDNLTDARYLRKLAASLEQGRALLQWHESDWADTDRLRRIAARLESPRARHAQTRRRSEP